MQSLSSSLLERTLRFDGVSEVDPIDLTRYLLLGVPPDKLRVTSETSAVAQLNAQVAPEDEVRLATPEPIALDMGWQLPELYESLDLEEHILDIFTHKVDLGYDDEQFEKAVVRINDELAEIKRLGMEKFMRTIIYILDEFRKNDVVWGVGRGSSCASYLLFLIGLHVVDCVSYDVPMQEFFH